MFLYLKCLPPRERTLCGRLMVRLHTRHSCPKCCQVITALPYFIYGIQIVSYVVCTVFLQVDSYLWVRF
jgi:hypothetical protein